MCFYLCDAHCTWQPVNAMRFAFLFFPVTDFPTPLLHIYSPSRSLSRSALF